MAGDWHPIRADLSSDFAVLKIARTLGIDRWSVVGRLSDIWGWVGSQSLTGVDVPLDSEMLDERVSCQGFAAAMRAVGWLAGRDGALIFPKWERYNSMNAKARALEAEAKRLRRGGKMSDNPHDESSDNPSDDASGDCPTNGGRNVGLQKSTSTNPPNPPAAQGGNGQKPMSDRRNRSTARRVRAREVIDGRLKTLRNEWDDIMHPGGSACAVVPKDGTSKAQRLQAMTAEIDSLERERKELQECST